ncbi:hypothetical protein F8M41_003414 [Gigaspora margarita]|uniref:Uncharacterized protein n=1 Tax=Gigaspora margarita TaxID=4874 RepID=A0A8H4EVM6_GIGMA|nr:hypothetical protein F8M41_003414 [Gigaspora margarita]
MSINIQIPENAAQIINSHLTQIFAVTNTQHDFGEFVGWLNNWESRDSYARANGMWNYRFSVDGLIHGKWYCCMKRNYS